MFKNLYYILQCVCLHVEAIMTEREREGEVVSKSVSCYCNFVYMHLNILDIINANMAHLQCDEMNNWHRH